MGVSVPKMSTYKPADLIMIDGSLYKCMEVNIWIERAIFLQNTFYCPLACCGLKKKKRTLSWQIVEAKMFLSTILSNLLNVLIPTVFFR
jgi:hypothetical protein